jgi:hypothetical protein
VVAPGGLTGVKGARLARCPGRPVPYRGARTSRKVLW